ncbi:MAG TPA: nucleotidyltransferase family protein, partial [Bryobacteraceae bacterium]|nr:nucleotidyltransferase family protein [Bryobacteraceae bacterium]
IELHWRFEKLWGTCLDERWRALSYDPQPRARRQFDLLYCCLHGSSHGWSRLKWLGDIRVMIGLLNPDDWVPLLKAARELRMETLLAQAVLLLNSVFGLPIPAGAKELMLKHGDPAQVLASEAWEWIALPENLLWRSRLRLRRLESRLCRRHPFYQRASHWLLHTLFSTADIERMQLPDWLTPSYPILRPITLASRVVSASARRMR